MPVFIALLRAVNVGGTGKLSMSDLVAMCSKVGFRNVRTYIASGNVVFESAKSEAAIKAALEKCLEAYARKPVGVMVRSAAEMAAVVAANPFPEAPCDRVVAIFLDDAPPADTLDKMTGQKHDVARLGLREIYVHYDQGIGGSKLKIPAAKAGTARNMNTIAKLAAMAAGG